MTGRVAGSSSELEVPVHKVNAVVMRTRNSSQPMLMVTYTCSTPENARINATMFINTSSPKDKDHEFFRRRRMVVSLPMPANRVSYLVKNAQLPKTVKVKKNGKYWNVITENFNSRGANAGLLPHASQTLKPSVQIGCDQTGMQLLKCSLLGT